MRDVLGNYKSAVYTRFQVYVREEQCCTTATWARENRRYRETQLGKTNKLAKSVVLT